MRYGQLGRRHLNIPIKDEVDVNTARRALSDSAATQLGFNGQTPSEQLEGEKLGVEFGGEVEIPRLICDSNRLGFANLRMASQSKSRFFEKRKRTTEVSFTVAEIRTEA